MPNGFHGSREEWQRMEAPLLRVEPVFEAFAKKHHLAMSKNYHNWPERSLKWDRPVERLIQLFLVDEKALTFNLWLCASEDRGRKRYWKNDYLVKERPLREFEQQLPDLLQEAFDTVSSWRSEQLEFATKLAIP